MSDDQGDAERGTSAGGQGASPGGARPDGGEVQDLRRLVEELAQRMGAGFREDLAQLRAITAAVAERDVSDDVKALRADVAALASAGAPQPVLDELGAVRAELARLASADAVSGVRADLTPVQVTLDRIAARLDDDSGRSQVLARFQAVESKLDALAGSGDRGSELAARLDQLDQRLEGLAGADQVGRLAGDLAAHLADVLGGLDGEAIRADLATLRAEVGRIDGESIRSDLAGLRSDVGSDRRTLVEALQDHLADVASGEVVGALWDEVRGLREAVDSVAAASSASTSDGPDPVLLDATTRLRAEVEGIGAVLAATADPQADPAVAGMRGDVQALVDEVRALSDAVATIERDAILPRLPDPEPERGDEPDPVLVHLTEELATLRAELSEGLVVEPSDALSASLDALRVEVDGLHEAIGDVRSQATAPATQPAGPSEELVATLFDELVSIRSGVDEVRGRLDEGLVLEHEEPASASTGSAEVEVLVDQVGALRDLVASEVDGLRDAVVAVGDRVDEAARASAEDAARARVEVEGLHEALGEVRSEATAPAPQPTGPSADLVATLFDELASIRSGVDDVRGRLDEGLVLEHGESPSASTGSAEIEVLADQVAALRDLVASEVDGLREVVFVVGDRAEEAARTRGEAPVPVAPAADGWSELDADVVEGLKDEIRAAGAIADEVIDALRKELQALRRRIAVKASEKVLDEEQLRLIADAVAERLQKP